MRHCVEMSSQKRNIGVVQVELDLHLLETHFLAPLAKGQRANVMTLCLSCARTSVRASINFAFKKLFLRNL